jgi:hypothetical protein
MVYKEEYHREVKVTLYLYCLFLVVADFCGDTTRLWRIQRRLAAEFRSEKIPRNRLGTAYVIPRKNVLIPRHSEVYGRAYSEVPNERKEMA